MGRVQTLESHVVPPHTARSNSGALPDMAKNNNKRNSWMTKFVLVYKPLVCNFCSRASYFLQLAHYSSYFIFLLSTSQTNGSYLCSKTNNFFPQKLLLDQCYYKWDFCFFCQRKASFPKAHFSHPEISKRPD